MFSVFRSEVPADGQEHVIAAGVVKAVAAKDASAVEFWWETRSMIRERYFRVFGTGDEIPEGYSYQGTTQRVFGLVWHLYARY